jgi:hypothetical protein
MLTQAQLRRWQIEIGRQVFWYHRALVSKTNDCNIKRCEHGLPIREIRCDYRAKVRTSPEGDYDISGAQPSI